MSGSGGPPAGKGETAEIPAGTPPLFDRGEWVFPWALVAVLLAVLGAAASIWRPFAPSLPAVPTDIDRFDPAVLDAVSRYRTPRTVIAVVVTALNLLVPLLVVATHRGRTWIRRWAGPASHSVVRAGAVGLAVAMITSAARLPFAAWTRVLHDGRWGFRTQPAIGWFRDWLLVSGGTWLAVAVLAPVLVVAIRRWPRSWPYRLTVLGTTIAAGVVLVHPVLLQPLLLPTGPLPAGPHRDAIESMVSAADLVDLPVVMGEASTRSTRVNAQRIGLGPTARIVVHDTMLELPPSQVAAVVAHEVAHHENRDVERGTLLAATVLLPALLLLRRLIAWPRVRGRLEVRGPTDPRLIAVVLVFVAVAELAVQPVTNLVSRQLESAADARSVELTGDAATLVRATRVFTVRDLAAPEPAPWITVLYRTHPSVGERLRQAAAIADRDALELPSLADLEAGERVQLHNAVQEGSP